MAASASVSIFFRRLQTQGDAQESTKGQHKAYKAYYQEVRERENQKEQLQKSIQSWTGHAGHADSYNLRKKIETLAEAAIEKAT